MVTTITSIWVRLTTRLRPSPDHERGASVVEYALLVALIALVCMGALAYFGGESGNSLDSSSTSIINAG